MLVIKNLSKHYGKTRAVDALSFNIESGEVCVVLGANGAGKSTTIQSIVGILRYDGEILLDGLSTKDVESKRHIAYVPEIPALFDMLTVKEHILYMAKAYGVDVQDEQVSALMERFDLTDKADKFGDELSKGMMQKVSICCALIVDPDLLVLDEPMVGLDPKAIKELRSVILELKQRGKTVFLSTHMLEMVEELWDRVIMMKQGKLVGDYVRSDYSDKNLDEIYFAINQESPSKHSDYNGEVS